MRSDTRQGRTNGFSVASLLGIFLFSSLKIKKKKFFFFFFFFQSKEWNFNLYLQDMTGYEIPHRNKFRGQLHRVCTVYNCSSIVSFVKSATIKKKPHLKTVLSRETVRQIYENTE